MKTHLLLVEDDPVFSKIVESKLESSLSTSVVLHTSTRLSDSLAMLKSHSIDLVILDLNLPDSMGVETLISVRKAAPELPVIVLTGEDDIDVHMRVVQEGALQIIGKSSEWVSSLPLAIIAGIDRRLAEGKTVEQFDQRLDAIQSLLNREFRKLDSVEKDVKIMLKCIFGNGDKKASIIYNVDKNTRVRIYTERLFWLAIGSLASALGASAVAWLWSR